MITLPLQGFLNNFRSEVGSIFEELKRSHNKQLRDEALRSRIRELALSWDLQLASHNKLISKVSAQKIQVNLSAVARLSTKLTKKQNYYPHFRETLQHLDTFINEVGKELSLAIIDTHSAERYVNAIHDLPKEFFPKSLIGWKPKIEKFLSDHPFDSNVFIIVRYAEESEALIKAVKSAIEEFQDRDVRFFPVIARDVNLTDDLYNPIACLLCCKYGIVIFDNVDKKPEINPNVSYELGFMHLLQRKCLLLKDKNLKSLHSDILQKLYSSYSSAADAKKITTAWLKELLVE